MNSFKVFLKLSLSLVFVLPHISFAYCENTIPDKVDEKKISQYYGEAFEVKSPVNIKDALKKFSKYSNTPIQMSASVKTVCQNKGCWMALGSDSESIRVRFKDYGFFVPISLVGNDIVVNGTLERKLVSKELLQHFKEDEKATEDEISAITTDQYEYTFTASGVFVQTNQ